MVSIKHWSFAKEELERLQVKLPTFDVAALKAKGRKQPVWIHIGGGNLYRSFHAQLAQQLAAIGELSAGVVVCETFDQEVIEKVYQPYQQDILQVILYADGRLEKQLLAATADSLYCQPENPDGLAQMSRYFENPALQLVTLTITEKGYHLQDSVGQLLPVIQADLAGGPTQARHTISLLTAFLYKRFLAGGWPLALVSTDNFSQNGQRLQESVLQLAAAWQANGQVPAAFLAYLQDPEQIAFPWSMIDRITPNPSPSVQAELLQAGLSELPLIQTTKRTNLAPFANTEAVHYLVLEDRFPNGRPALEKVGVFMTDRETVDKAEVMKVTTCLNPLHTALAVTGCLLGYTSIAAELQDEDLVGLIKGIGYQEGLPVAEDPGILQPHAFIDEVIHERLPNPRIPDTPQRIACDTSQKVAIRFGETIKKYVEKEQTAESLLFIPLTLAAWLRYLLAVDDQGQPFSPSPDPLLTELQAALAPIQLGEQEGEQIHRALQPLLANPRLFGCDLYQAGLGEKVEQLFREMLVGPQAVRHTLHHYVTKFGGKTNGNDF